MAFTTTITISNGSRTQISNQTWAYSVTIGESIAVAGFPTSDYLLAKPAGGTQRRIQAGTPYTIQSPDRLPFPPGTVLGDLQMVLGTTTFFVDEA